MDGLLAATSGDVGPYEKAWADEIRAWLLGRLHRNRDQGAIPQVRAVRLEWVPILRWWIFEGRRYEGLARPLGESWSDVLRAVRALRTTWNPRLRITDVPTGDVDWGRTLARGPSALRPEWVCHSSGSGLREEEWRALQLWSAWIAAEWRSWRAAWKQAPGDEILELGMMSGDIGMLQPHSEGLRRCAHIARRSRWPFLRNVVAGSLRALLEPEDVDRLPLPAGREDLFELLCLVRILREFAPPHPNGIRWLDHGLNRNQIRIPGATAFHQLTLDENMVLETHLFRGPPADAIRRFGVSMPRRVDVLVRFDPPRGGFGGILLEAKSGTQPPRSALLQLLAYRAALPHVDQGRLLVWGVVEKPVPERLSPGMRDGLRRAAATTAEDVWVFSGAGDIGAVLADVGIVEADGCASCRPRIPWEMPVTT